jgi:uncharacterized protein (DUF433 family)
MSTREGTVTAMKLPISTAPDMLGGTPVFAGTRVPIQTLFDYLEGGESIDDFLDGFPSVSRDQVIAFLEMAKSRMIETTRLEDVIGCADYRGPRRSVADMERAIAQGVKSRRRRVRY